MGKKDLDNMDNTRTKLNQKLSTRIPLELRLLRYMDNKDNTFNKNKKKTVVHRPQSRIPLAYFKKFSWFPFSCNNIAPLNYLETLIFICIYSHFILYLVNVKSIVNAGTIIKKPKNVQFKAVLLSICFKLNTTIKAILKAIKGINPNKIVKTILCIVIKSILFPYLFVNHC